jgi:hypothetical protein
VHIGSNLIVNALYLPSSKCFMLSTNDKYLNTYDLGEKRVVSRFLMDNLQTLLAYSP